MRHPKIFLLCASVAIVFLSIGSMMQAADAKKETPMDLTLTGMDGKKVHLHDYAGKPIVLNIWATWCLPCKDEMPMLVEAEKTWGTKGVVFIAASYDDSKTKKNIPQFVKQLQITFPVWSGVTDDDLDKLKLGDPKTVALPDTAFMDADHIIFSRAKGEIHRPELDERLNWVTGDRKGPAPEAVIVHLDK